jgi:hypothetical protein
LSFGKHIDPACSSAAFYRLFHLLPSRRLGIINYHNVAVLVNMLFVCTFAYHFEAVLIIGHVLSILISDLITPVIVPFSVDYSKAVLVLRDELAIYHNHLMALFDVLVVVSILVDRSLPDCWHHT